MVFGGVAGDLVVALPEGDKTGRCGAVGGVMGGGAVESEAHGTICDCSYGSRDTFVEAIWGGNDTNQREGGKIADVLARQPF